MNMPTLSEHQLQVRNNNLQAEVDELLAQLREAKSKLKSVTRERDRLRQKLGINTRNPDAKKEIIAHMENGLRNCEIVALGYSKSTVKNTRRMLVEIENDTNKR
jgi:hypothetical protein